jgi:hypothetical protein
MADAPLNFNPDDLGDDFDSAPDPSDALSAFDNAAGVTVLAPGWYECRLESGAYVTTKKGKPAYRIKFAAVAPAEVAGFVLWRYQLLDADNANQAKAALSPLGIRSGADIRRAPFPEAGRRITCRVLVGVQKDDPTRNDVLRFEVVSDERDDDSSAGRFALPNQP